MSITVWAMFHLLANQGPLLFDDDAFIPYDAGDATWHTSRAVELYDLNLPAKHPILALAAPHQHPVGGVTMNQLDINSQLTMQYELYQQTESQLFLMQQSDTEVP
jgi:hypothetical protein